MAGRSALWHFGAWTLVPLWFMAAIEGMGLLSSNSNRPTGLLLWVLVMVVMVVCWAPFWWLIFFLCFASGPALRHAFHLSTLHAALPALVTTVLVWVFAFLGLSAGGLPPGPVPLADCAFLGGPVSVTAVAWWEIHRLHSSGRRRDRPLVHQTSAKSGPSGRWWSRPGPRGAGTGGNTNKWTED